MKTKIAFLLRLIAASILLQTLFFKFTGASESKFIFTTLGIEPWGRWFSGVSELLASILLLVPFTQFLGAILSVGIMVGAIVSHIFILGIVVQDDGGLLFSLACTVVICSVLIIFIHRNQTAIWIKRVQNLL